MGGHCFHQPGTASRLTIRTASTHRSGREITALVPANTHTLDARLLGNTRENGEEPAPSIPRNLIVLKALLVPAMLRRQSVRQLFAKRKGVARAFRLRPPRFSDWFSDWVQRLFSTRSVIVQTIELSQNDRRTSACQSSSRVRRQCVALWADPALARPQCCVAPVRFQRK